MSAKILIVDDEENLCFTLERFLVAEGHEVTTADTYSNAMAALGETAFDLIFADIILKGRSGIEILREIKQRQLPGVVVMITGAPTIDSASEAVRLGAFDYLPKPVTQQDLIRVAKAALRFKALADEKEKYRLNLAAIFKSVKDAIIMVDENLTVIEVNAAAKDICGVARGHSIGKPVTFMESACCQRCLNALSETIRTQRSIEIQRLECRHAYRSAQVISLSTYPLSGSRNIKTGGVMVIRDETRLADLERNLKARRGFHHIVGKSEKMQEIYSLIEDLADVRTTALITGESGTGKELVAEAIHYKGPHPDHLLVKVNCAALSEELLESELFGHVKGAFTGAVRDKIGRFQRADGGTIFLDEIGEMSPRMQLHFLRVLQDMEFERVGDSTPIKVDVRVIAATNKDLVKEIAAGGFRQDLYYRLKVVELNLPPLRKRLEDIPLLIDHFLKIFNQKFSKKMTDVSSDVRDVFMKYDWPGNIRELEHALEHAAILCRGETITLDHLPKELKAQALAPDDESDGRIILRALEKARWNKTEAARLLGMSRQSLYRKIKAFKVLENKS
jgi:PAS domain S-box-containing protein